MRNVLATREFAADTSAVALQARRTSLPRAARRRGRKEVPMRIAILTNEYPPHVYGGAGVPVEDLTRELARAEGGRHAVTVLSFGDQAVHAGNLTVRGVAAPFVPSARDPRHQKFLDALARDLQMAGLLDAADVVHCHTWYSHLAGC